MNIDLTDIIVALLFILASIATKYVIPYFKNKAAVYADKLDAEKRAKLVFWAKLAVEAAEKFFKDSGMGVAKKKWVIEFLESKGFELNENEIDVAIESAVLEMQNAIAG